MPIKTELGALKLITYVSIVRDERILLVEYETPPNPDKKGWWIPAPEIDWAEAPTKRAAQVLDEVGLPKSEAVLTGTESFVVGEAWHVIFHFRAEVAVDPKPGSTIHKWSWFGADNMPQANEFAHGKWERNLAIRQLESPALAT